MDIEYVLRHVAHLMPKWQTDAVEDVVYLPGGYSNANYALTYRGARYVLRIPQGAQPFVDRVHERAWYAGLPEHVGVRPIALDAQTGHMLSPWVEGKLLVDVMPELSLADLANYLRALHRDLPEDPRVYDLSAINAAFWREEAPPYAAASHDAGSAQTCHNDLNPWNILLTEQGWVTLDWEFVGRNDPLFDLVSLHHGLELPPAELEQFARLYLGDDTLVIGPRLAQAQRSFWIRELGWAQYQLKAGNEREEIRAQKETALQALARLAI